ncbi:NAD-dependent epimerase/dehydratase family protein [Phytoactinopolyspora mesophila]|uniref:NAD-dependent epimerase/dehydratase family protein n=1 Tax=Phytoactinopolyspora mesophila TaxID=2650750 RepID=A0A7K3LY79_9ACTN|nr:NAD(P)-dependent oxidoreductase [Phytoactinopolyspora mesophila]NDL55993.1 NAD-dependent epimerase/dehydratase family protein [Phytoactinopolyspora mesophila]
MRVLVTGATGRVGANMVRRLLSSGADVKAMVMPGDPQAVKLSAMSGLEIVEAELTDQAGIDAACRDVTHVVHLAAQLVRGQTPVDRFYDINAFGTLRLLEGVVRAGGVERFLLASTDGTYRPGDPPMVPLPEDAPQEPADYYGTSKLLGETILRNHAVQFDIPYVITRFATVLDPVEASGLFRVAWLRSLLGKAELGRDTNIWQLFHNHPNLRRIFDAGVQDAPDDTAAGLLGPDGQPWSIHLLDVRDAVEGLYLALTVPGASGRAFNITAAAPTKHDDGASIIAELYEVPKIMVEMPKTWRLEMAVDAARDVLGYQPKHDFRSMAESARHGGSGDEYIPARV